MIELTKALFRDLVRNTSIFKLKHGQLGEGEETSINMSNFFVTVLTESNSDD